MAKSRSKSKRREIARHISRKRHEQSGYGYLARYREYMQRRFYYEIDLRSDALKAEEIALLTRSPLPLLAHSIISGVSKFADVLASHFFWTVLGFFALIYIFSWGVIFEAAIIVLVFLAPALILSHIVMAIERRIRSAELKVINDDFDKWIADRPAQIDAEYMALCDEFVGYPPDWSERRSAVLARDGYACQSCLKELDHEHLHVHHIIEVAHGGTAHLSNLTTLCNSCHGKEHGGRL